MNKNKCQKAAKVKKEIMHTFVYCIERPPANVRTTSNIDNSPLRLNLYLDTENEISQ